MSEITLQHENGTQTKVGRSVSLKLAFESGYRWINFGDGRAWLQLAYLVRQEKNRKTVGL